MENKDTAALAQMKILEEALDEYEQKIGLPAFVENAIEDDVRKYISMNRTQMEKLSVEDCAEIALLLGGFSFHLQRCLNREIARVGWADSRLKKLISGKENQYRGSWDSQFQQAIKGDDFAKDLLRLKNYAQQRVDRLTFLATSIKNMRDDFKNLQMAKVMK